MKNINTFATSLLALLVFLTISCTPTSNEEGKNGKMHIVATTGMIADIVKNVAGDHVTVEALMGPGVDPHLYKATQGDLSKLRSADLILYNGLHLEGKLGEIFKNLAKIKPAKAVSDGIDRSKLINNTTMGGQYDPHIWFDVALWQETVEYVGNALQEMDTVNAAYYKTQTKLYYDQLTELHLKVQSEIASIPEDKRILITAHDAFSYFGRAYHIEVKGLQGISTMSEFGLKDVADLVNFISDREIKAVFVESSVPEKYIQSVVEGCQEKGHEVKVGGTLFSDAMGNDGTPEGTYIGMMDHNVETIVSSLK